MSSAARIDRHSARRILANVQEKRRTESHEFIGDPERLLSRPPKTAKPKQRISNWVSRHRTIVELLWLGVIAIGGIAAIIGLRNVGAEYGVIWLGDR